MEIRKVFEKDFLRKGNGEVCVRSCEVCEAHLPKLWQEWDDCGWKNINGEVLPKTRKIEYLFVIEHEFNSFHLCKDCCKEMVKDIVRLIKETV